jgi:hypothetical protein
MRVHVVPAIGQEPGTAAHALHGETCLLGHAAGRRVSHGMFEVKPVKASRESPAGRRVNRPRRQALSPGRRDGPVSDLCRAVRKIQVLQASAAEQDAASRFDDRPDRMRTQDPAHGFRPAQGPWRCDISPVGLAGFEPATSATQTRRASQAALQPVPTKSSVPGCRVASSTADCSNLTVRLGSGWTENVRVGLDRHRRLSPC